jgi:hypothetical protein
MRNFSMETQKDDVEWYVQLDEIMALRVEKQRIIMFLV